MIRHHKRLRLSFEDSDAEILDSAEELRPLRELLQNAEAAVLALHSGDEMAVLEHVGARVRPLSLLPFTAVSSAATAVPPIATFLALLLIPAAALLALTAAILVLRRSAAASVMPLSLLISLSLPLVLLLAEPLAAFPPLALLLALAPLVAVAQPLDGAPLVQILLLVGGAAASAALLLAVVFLAAADAFSDLLLASGLLRSALVLALL